MKTKMAKIFAVFAVLTLIISSVIPAFAAKTVTLTLDILGQDGVVYVRLTAPEGSDIATFSSTVSFDTSKLSYNAVNYMSGDSILTMTNDANADNGAVSANLVLADSLTDETAIVTYAFDLLDGAEGEIAFDFTNIEVTDSNDEPISIVFDKAASINISELKPLEPGQTDEPTSEEATFEEPTTAAGTQDVDSPNIPGTSGRTIAIVSAVSVIVIAVAAGTVIYTVRRKKVEE